VFWGNPPERANSQAVESHEEQIPGNMQTFNNSTDVIRAVARHNGTTLCQFHSSFQLKGFQSQLFWTSFYLTVTERRWHERSRGQEGRLVGGPRREMGGAAPGILPRQKGAWGELRGWVTGHQGLVAKRPLGEKAEIKGCRRAETLLRRK